MAKTTVKSTNKKTTKKKGGTASTKVNTVPIYVQPPFDIRIQKSLSKPFQGTGHENAGIRRGFMVWDDTQTPPTGYDKKEKDYPAVVRFLFNPSTISTSFQVASGAQQAALNYGQASGADGALLLPLQQQTSFSLMFDRTYEMNDPTSSDDIKNYGVDVDIAALRQYTGMYAGVYAHNADFTPFTSSNVIATAAPSSRTDPNQVNAKTGVGPLGKLTQGIMQVTLGFVYFSGPTSTAVGGNGYGLTYYGYIDSWSVEYTHFSANMIPIRCVVDISFTFLPPPITPIDTKGAASIAQSQAVTAVNDIVGTISGITNLFTNKAGR